MEPLCTVGGNVDWWKAVQRFLEKVGIELPCDPAIAVLGLFPKESKAGPRTRICIPVFITVLFTGVKK